MSDYEGLEDTFSEDLERTAEKYGIGVSSWMDADGRINPAVWVEDTAIIMHDQTKSKLGPDYELVNIVQMEDLEDSNNYEAESDLSGLLEEEEVEYWGKLRDVIGELDNYTDVSSYLKERGIILNRVNDGLLDAFVRGPETRGDY
jgi:hypothetical protein